MKGYTNISVKKEDHKKLRSYIERQGFNTFPEFFRDLIRKEEKKAVRA